MQKKTILLLSAILSLFFTNPAVADESVIYDTGRLAINTWHLHLSKHTFNVDRPQDGYLQIRKNTPTSDIRAGLLILNHRLIPLTRFLTGPDAVCNKPIGLRSVNLLRIFLIGSPAASITITAHTEKADTPPSVTLDAQPDTIDAGSTSTLSWSSENANACTLEPGIANVDTVGSVVVSPAVTTTYNVTATGPGGTTSSAVTVTVVVPAPSIELSADPLEISLGSSASLTWSTEHAEAVSIDQGIGAVQPSGTIVVFPDTDTTYTVTANGPGGTATRSVTITVVPQLSLQITSPLDRESINRQDVMVRGTFANSTGNETGITVNGQVAMVYGNQFVVNHLPLRAGSNTITGLATDANGSSQKATVSINASFPDHQITLTPTLSSGSAPLAVSLKISGSFSIEDATLNYSGSAPAELMEVEPDEYQVSITEQGITYFTAEVVHGSAVYMDTIAIVVVDKAAIDRLLQKKWADMKTALKSGDIEGALKFHHERYHERYTAIYNALGNNLPTLVDQMQDISWICYIDGTAKYRIRQNHDIKGKMVTITYYIYFSRGDNGLWVIEKY